MGCFWDFGVGGSKRGSQTNPTNSVNYCSRFKKLSYRYYKSYYINSTLQKNNPFIVLRLISILDNTRTNKT